MLNPDHSQELVRLVNSMQGDLYIEHFEKRIGEPAFLAAIRRGREQLAEIGSHAEIKAGVRVGAYEARKAVMMLAKIGPDGYAEMEQIFARSTDPETRTLALHFFHFGAERAIPHLQAILQNSSDGAMVAGAIDAAAQLGSVGAPLLDDIIIHHRNQNSPVHEWIGTERTLIYAIGACGAEQPEKASALLLLHLGFENGEQKREIRVPKGFSCRGSDNLDNQRAALRGIRSLGRRAQPYVERELRMLQCSLNGRGWIEADLACALAAVTGATD